MRVIKNYIFLTVVFIGLTSQVSAQTDQNPATGILFGCLFSGYLQCVLNQIDADGDVNAQLGQTPLMIVSGLGHTQIVEALLDAGADIHASTVTGWTPLTYAVNENHPDVIRLLLSRGADRSVLNPDHTVKLERLLEENPIQ